jgi:hypothetical protein
MDSEIISLDVGPKQTRYRIHRAILKQSSELDAKPALELWGGKIYDTIALPEIDEMTAHTLVHYLYTGRYHALDSHDPEDRSAISQYKLSTCAYCAAIRYKLPGLAELAKQTMVSLQKNLTILDVLLVAREHAFPLLPEDEAWFPEYLEGAIHTAFIEDAELFTRPGFVDQIEGDRRYRQVVMKAIVNSYSRGPAVNLAINDEKQQKSPRSKDLSSPVAETPKQDANATNMTSPDSLLEEINPTLDTHVAPEPYTDELGWESSTTYQKMGNQSVPADTTPAKPAHVRVDSVVQDNTTTPVSATPTEPVSDSLTSPIVNGTDNSAPTSKKNKKKKKKGAVATTAAPVADPATVVAQ